VRKGRRTGGVSGAESEEEEEKKGTEGRAEMGKSEGQEEVIRRLKVLEQKVNVSEVLLRTLLRDRLGQRASQTVEEFATSLSIPAPNTSTLEEACDRLGSQMEVIHGLQLDAWREFRRNARRLRRTEEEEEEAEESADGSEHESEESEDGAYEPSDESGEELGPDVEEEPEMEVGEDTPPPPEPVLDSGSEDWDSTLKW